MHAAARCVVRGARRGMSARCRLRRPETSAFQRPRQSQMLQAHCRSVDLLPCVRRGRTWPAPHVLRRAPAPAACVAAPAPPAAAAEVTCIADMRASALNLRDRRGRAGRRLNRPQLGRPKLPHARATPPRCPGPQRGPWRRSSRVGAASCGGYSSRCCLSSCAFGRCRLRLRGVSSTETARPWPATTRPGWGWAAGGRRPRGEA